MRKALMAAVLLFGMQDTTEDVFVSEVVDGMSFAIYEDADCTMPLLEDGEPVVLSIEEGKLCIPAAYEGMWIKETGKRTGYYPMQEAVEIEEEMVIPLEEIHYEITLDYAGDAEGDFVYEIVDEEGNASEVVIEDSLDIGEYLVAGETFTLKEKSIPEAFTPHGDVTLEVPLEKGEEELQLPLVYERRTVLLFKGKEDSEAGMMLYKDEEATEPLKTDGLFHMDETIYLDAGTYWYRMEEVSALYYENPTLYRLDIDPSSFQYMEETVPMDRVKFVVEMEESPYILHVFHEDRETASFQADGKEHILYGERDSTYTICAKAQHDVYDLEEVVIKTGKEQEEQRIRLEPHPFAVHVRLFDTYQKNCPHGLIRVMDDAFQEVAQVETAGDYAAVEGLVAGRTYWLEVVGSDVLHSDGMVKLVVDGSDSYEMDVPVVTFVTMSLQSEDNDARFSLYVDESCALTAKDQKNVVLEDISSGTYSLLPGTYYLKQTMSGKTYYRNDAVEKLQVTQSFTHVIGADAVQVSLMGKHGDVVVSEAELELLEEGEVIDRWKGEKTMTLQRGRVYTLRQAAPLTGFLQAEEVLFSTPEHKPDEPLSMFVEFDAYTILTLKGEVNVGAMLYTDVNCTMPAYDVDGWVAETRVDESGISRLRMPEGTYYLMEKGGAGFYEAGQIRQIELVSPYAEEVLTPVPVSFSIRFLDALGEAVEGASFSLRDEAGNVLEEWTSSKDPYVTKTRLLAGGAYIIHQDKAAEGYERMKTDIVYTLPSEAPESVPVVTIEAKQYMQSSSESAKTVQDMEDIRNERHDGYLYVLAGAGIVLLVFLVVRRRYKERKSIEKREISG